MREAIGPVAAFRNSVCVTALPRTRSGKTARKSIADMAAGRTVQVRKRDKHRGIGHWNQLLQ